MTRAMLQTRVETDQRTPSHRYGYGVWSLVDGDGARAHYVEGRDFGVRTFSAIFPKDDLQVTILDNVGEGADRVWRGVRGVIDARARQAPGSR